MIKLPDPEKRFTPFRKKKILMAIAKKIISEADALELYKLSKDELREWKAKYESGVFA